MIDEATDVDRLNELLDAITAKRFISPVIFVQAVRSACALHGIALPLLDIEGTNGPTVEDGKFVLARISSPQALDMYAAPTEGEYIFHCEDGNGNITDTYLYMVVDRDDEGLYDAYAQLVSEDELHDVLNVDEKDYPELVGDISGETKYLAQTRRSRGDMVDETPPDV